MTTIEAINYSLKKLPEDKINLVLAFVKFIEFQNSEAWRFNGSDCALLSESSLAKDWLRKEEEEAWRDLFEGVEIVNNYNEYEEIMP